MMYAFLNCGSGPVREATLAQARLNIAAFVKELTERGHLKPFGGVKIDDVSDRSRSDGGRWTFTLRTSRRSAKVMMPGCPRPDSWKGSRLGEDFPRLYVEGNSWIWWIAQDIVEVRLGRPEWR